MKLVIVGAGKVATQIAIALHGKGVEIVQVYNRTKENGEILAKKIQSKSISRINGLNTEADLYIMAVRDDVIPLMLEKLKSRLPSTSIVVHTAGTVGIDVFDTRFRNGGILWPIQSFSNGTKVNWESIPIVLEAKTKKALRKMEKVAHLLSDKIYYYSSEQKIKLHLAAVFANNFTNHMLHIAHQVCAKNDLDFEVLKPLLFNTIEKLDHMSPAESQTGPAVRGDEKTMMKHLKLLAEDSDKAQIYEMISRSIQKGN